MGYFTYPSVVNEVHHLKEKWVPYS